ncbi:hypothetical protein KQI52_01525 [bacterium]|nr:hypothetical protein [bacterium]
MHAKRWLAYLAVFSLLFSLGYLVTGCSEEDDDNPVDPTAGPYSMSSEESCEGCHTNEDMLKATVAEDTTSASESTGEG